MKNTAALRKMPPPLPPPPQLQAAGAVYFEMDTGEDVEPAPAATRPAPPEEVQPQPGEMGRHCGSGYELVLDATVPQLEKVVEAPFDLLKVRDIVAAWNVEQVRVREAPEVQVARDYERRGIAQEIPEVQVPPRVAPRRVQQRTVQFVDAPVPQVSSQERISERILEQIADTYGSRGIPQERVSERIVEQIVPVPHSLPAERISERIQKQTVGIPSPQSIPQERISERIAEPNVEVDPGPAGRGTSSSSAATLDVAECPVGGVFRTFPRRKKVRKSAGSRVRTWCRTRAHGHRRPIRGRRLGTTTSTSRTWLIGGAGPGRSSITGSSLMAAGMVPSRRPRETYL